jgi:hypothetical protein
VCSSFQEKFGKCQDYEAQEIIVDEDLLPHV